ncbi:hypothetical protein B2I21_32940 [Chryseobacterium mucoviscidosis]|uniref:hypothetical protein n=1 Tax=unclassified Paenibacillus TaxID=185978 RepID=UPI0009A278F7|nr:hypothetical protein B2I21_32940 [Chryseobacterium mucoviscidosis]
MTKTKSSEDENKEKIKQVLLHCEKAEDSLHKKLAGIINELWDVPGVRKELLSEIESLYVEKGELYCLVAYAAGYRSGNESHENR